MLYRRRLSTDMDKIKYINNYINRLNARKGMAICEKRHD